MENKFSTFNTMVLVSILLLSVLLISGKQGEPIGNFTPPASQINIPAIGANEKIYIFGAGKVAKLDSVGITYVHNDYLGSASLETDASRNIVSRNTYYPFGAELTTTGNEKYTFTGKEVDETQLQYFGARYYDQDTGRFTQIDPIGPGYAYANNNPLRFVDPDGKDFYSASADALDSDTNLVFTGHYEGDVFVPGSGDYYFYSLTPEGGIVPNLVGEQGLRDPGILDPVNYMAGLAGGGIVKALGRSAITSQEEAFLMSEFRALNQALDEAENIMTPTIIQVRQDVIIKEAMEDAIIKNIDDLDDLLDPIMANPSFRREIVNRYNRISIHSPDENEFLNVADEAASAILKRSVNNGMLDDLTLTPNTRVLSTDMNIINQAGWDRQAKKLAAKWLSLGSGESGAAVP